MTVEELKKKIDSKSFNTPMVWVDNNHTLVLHYLDHLSFVLNRKIRKIFTIEDFMTISFDSDQMNTLYLLYFNKKEIAQAYPLIKDEMVIFMVDEDPEIKSLSPVVFGKISKNACIVFLENYVEIPQKKKDEDRKEPEHYISRDLIEKLVDYFDGNLDLCMNEIKKVESLELTTSWNHPFQALLDSLPKKNKKLRSLSWFSGGDIDTCQVIYNMYIKKLRTLTTATRQEQEIWARLIRESVWCEACIVSGLIGDYVIDYLRLVESSLPGDFRIQFFPPVFHKDLKDFEEWIPEEEKS